MVDFHKVWYLLYDLVGNGCILGNFLGLRLRRKEANKVVKRRSTIRGTYLYITYLIQQQELDNLVWRFRANQKKRGLVICGFDPGPERRGACLKMTSCTGSNERRPA